VFQIVQEADRAWRRDCREPWTGLDDEKYPVLVFKILRPQFSSRATGPGTRDNNVAGMSVNGRFIE